MFIRDYLDFGFIVLAPDCNLGRVQGTIRSIGRQYPDKPVICVVCSKAKAESEEISKLCPVHLGGDTIVSLINKGLEQGYNKWNLFILEGATLKRGVDERYSLFLKGDNDIFFPIISDRNREGIPVKLYSRFDNCTLNGLFIHQETYKKVGKFHETEDLEVSRLDWGQRAMDIGCKFKGVLGIKII